MAWLTDPFQAEFMQRALLGGLLAVVTTSLIGTWVVIRGLSFVGDALAHGVLPGIALAYYVGFDLTIGALLGAAVMVAGVAVVGRRSGLSEDTGIGLLFVGMLALGVLVMSRAGSFAVDLTAFLFGDILGVDGNDLVLQAVIAAITVAGCVVFHRAFLVLSFNRQRAELLGLRPGLAHAVMLGLLALSIVGSFRAVGTLLVFGLLVAPPATAALIVRRVPAMMLASVGFGSFAVVSGLVLSYHADLATGATMSAMAVGVFFAVLTVREIAAAVIRRRGTRARAASALVG